MVISSNWTWVLSLLEGHLEASAAALIALDIYLKCVGFFKVMNIFTVS